MRLIYVGVFGLLGIYARYLIGLLAAKYFNTIFPVGTLFINLSGAFLIGVVYAYGAERTVLSPELRLGILVGLLGGFTTFSSYCLEAVNLVRDGEYLYALIYLTVSPLLGFGGAYGGIVVGRRLLGGFL